MNPYRSADEEMLLCRRAGLIEERLQEVAALEDEGDVVADTYCRRWGRALFGAAGMAMAGLLVVAAVAGAPLLPVLDGSWLLLGLIVLAARPAAARSLRRVVARRLQPTDDLPGDLAALEATPAAALVARAADRLEARSVALPLSALALLVPLTLHRLAMIVFNFQHVAEIRWLLGRHNPMENWIKLSMVTVGHCHLLLVALAFSFARDLRRHPDFPEKALAARAGWGAFAWTSLASMPAALLFLCAWPVLGWVALLVIPTLVTLTGLLFIPTSFVALGRTIARERALLGCTMRSACAPPSSS